MISSLPRKQRRARYQAPLHRRHREMASPVDAGLRRRQEKRGLLYPRRLPIRKGDRVLIVRGDGRKGPAGERPHKVARVSRRRRKVYVDGFTYHKADNTELLRPIDPSNLVILNPDWSDPLRRLILQRVNEEAGRELSDADVAAVEEEEDRYEEEVTGISPADAEAAEAEAATDDEEVTEAAADDTPVEAPAGPTEPETDETAAMEAEADEPETPAEAAPGDTAIDYAARTVAELKVLLRERELPVSGRKNELIARLKEVDS